MELNEVCTTGERARIAMIDVDKPRKNTKDKTNNNLEAKKIED